MGSTSVFMKKGTSLSHAGVAMFKTNQPANMHLHLKTGRAPSSVEVPPILNLRAYTSLSLFGMPFPLRSRLMLRHGLTPCSHTLVTNVIDLDLVMRMSSSLPDVHQLCMTQLAPVRSKLGGSSSRPCSSTSPIPSNHPTLHHMHHHHHRILFPCRATGQQQVQSVVRACLTVCETGSPMLPESQAMSHTLCTSRLRDL